MKVSQTVCVRVCVCVCVCVRVCEYPLQFHIGFGKLVSYSKWNWNGIRWWKCRRRSSCVRPCRPAALLPARVLTKDHIIIASYTCVSCTLVVLTKWTTTQTEGRWFDPRKERSKSLPVIYIMLIFGSWLPKVLSNYPPPPPPPERSSSSTLDFNVLSTTQGHLRTNSGQKQIHISKIFSYIYVSTLCQVNLQNQSLRKSRTYIHKHYQTQIFEEFVPSILLLLKG